MAPFFMSVKRLSIVMVMPSTFDNSLVKYLNKKDKDGIKVYEVVRDFTVEIFGVKYRINKGLVTNFASIPKYFRWAINPRSEWIQYAAVCHDNLYNSRGGRLYQVGVPGVLNRNECDLIFLGICIETIKNIGGWKQFYRIPLAHLSYTALRIGGESSWKKCSGMLDSI